MGFMKFRIRCECGHINMPSNNTRNGIRITLSGDFNKCRKCGEEWQTIRVPLRPLVKKVAQEMHDSGALFSTNVRAYEYKGKVPMTQAIY